MKELPPAFNKLIAAQNGFTELYKGMDLDWTINAPPKIDTQYFGAGIKGLMFPKSQGEVEPPV